MDKLAAMETFVAIIDEGSLTAAAAAQDKALPTIVRSLALLEESLGVRLLHRTTRRMSLTEEGRTYLERCRRILSEVGEAEDELSAARSCPRGKIRITAPLLFGRKKLAPVLRSFLRAYPEVELDLVSADRVVDLVNEGFDVGLRIAPLPDSTLIASKVGEVRRTLVASHAFLKSSRCPQSPMDLADQAAVLFVGAGNTAHFSFLEKGKKLLVPVRGALRCNDAQVGIDACVHGLGFGQFLSYQVEDLIAEGRLVSLLEPYRLPAIPIHVMFPHTRLLSNRTRVLVDWLKKYL